MEFEPVSFYVSALLLLGSTAGVIFAPRMFLALISLFFAFFFTGVMCFMLCAKFIAGFVFVLGALVLCPVIFLLMKKINRWNLPLKLSGVFKIVVSSVVLTVFGVIACLFVKEEFSNSLFNIFNFVNEKSQDTMTFSGHVFPLHIVLILTFAAIIVIRGILTASADGEDVND